MQLRNRTLPERTPSRKSKRGNTPRFSFSTEVMQDITGTMSVVVLHNRIAQSLREEDLFGFSVKALSDAENQVYYIIGNSAAKGYWSRTEMGYISVDPEGDMDIDEVKNVYAIAKNEALTVESFRLKAYI